MKRYYSIALAAVAMALLAGSLPLDWMTIHGGRPGVSSDDDLGDQPTPSGPAAHITGLNGRASFLSIGMPIWLIVLLGLSGTVVSLLNSMHVTSQHWLVLLPLGVSGLYIALTLILSISIDRASPEIGNVIALVGIAMSWAHFTLYGQVSRV